MRHFYRSFFILVAVFLWANSVAGAQPANYYSSAEGKTGYALKTALHNIIKNHQVQSYSSLWNHFQSTDKKPNGKVWDMYSDVPGGTPAYEYSFGSDQCGSYSKEGDCYNREHSFPKSWFNNASPMYSDLFHLYPTDGYVNQKRGNYPFGEVANPEWVSTNGSKLGPCSFPGYSGKVFEPIDEYKGDFARTYFYMATRYQDIIASWENYTSYSDAVLDGSSDKVFEDWALNLLYSWHVQDPVSQKEIDRNNAIYAIQGNRNPYIDHPEWVSAVWGITQPTHVYWAKAAAIAYEAIGSPATYTVEVLLNNDLLNNCSVDIQTAGTATLGIDYTLSTTQLTFSGGQTRRTLTITLLEDAIIEADETIVLTLTSPTNGLNVGQPATFTLTLKDATARPTLNFAKSSDSFKEGFDYPLLFSLSAPLTEPQQLILTLDGTAVYGVDYETLPAANSGTISLTLPAGVQTYSLGVRLAKDNVLDDGETIIFHLRQLPDGLQAGSQTSFTLTILENSEYITAITTATDNSVRFYPNPARHALYVEGLPEGTTLQLLDAQGQVLAIWQHRLGAVWLLHYTKGLYFVRYMLMNQWNTQKVIIE
ncbi:endonuclease I [Thermonema lapsum]|uniref:Endonuclease I n=1 Tax=Thermonema lapsum TaxID=28195 RepID=A0A846MMZ5_9BACT|nr:endonuclease [Thermonema lapsum]NIK72839.1 endonuclease I [Thermonema lapsum]